MFKNTKTKKAKQNIIFMIIKKNTQKFRNTR